MGNHKLPIENIISQLGYEDSASLFKSKSTNKFEKTNLSVRFKKLLQELNPYATYILNDSPFILFFDKTVNNEFLFENICKTIWNAQIPIVIFCDTSTVKIYNGLSIDEKTKILKQIENINIEKFDQKSSFSYFNISNPLFWNEYESKFSSPRLDTVLLGNISYIRDELNKHYNISFANKLILRLIFIRYLIDRGVDLDYPNFSNNIEESQKEFLKILKSKRETYKLFKHLKEKFNGNLFDLQGENESKGIDEDAFSLLSNFFAGTIELQSGQGSLFPLYDFSIIPVELISNIYEILLGKEKQEKDNAFYTPNYLVEYILNNVLPKTLSKKSVCRILDPACGSGIFLVNTFRRIVQENLGESNYIDDDEKLKSLLTDNIYGIDIEVDAIDVTIFSLYLTILDYKNPKTLSNFKFPNLKGENLFVANFFNVDGLKSLENIKLDYIIGNPPWGNVKEGHHIKYCKERGYDDKQQNNEIARSFVFRAKDFCTPDTICCYILHSKLLYNQETKAVNFRKYLLKESEILDIIELSSVRNFIFKNAKAPAMILSFKYNGRDNLKHNFVYTSIKPNVFFKLFNIICIEKNDIKNIPQFLLYENDWAWKTIVYGFTQDFENVLRLKKKYDTINNAINSQIPVMLIGAGIEGHDGDKNDASFLIGKKLLNSKNGVDHFYVNTSNITIFNKKKIHRPRKKKLFQPPYVIIAKWIDSTNYKLKSAYTEESFIANSTMYFIKGEFEQKEFLLNLVGLLNSTLYAYLNIMTGSSIGIERGQRFIDELFEYPYLFSEKIVKKVEHIQSKKENILKDFSLNTDEEIEKGINELDKIILKEFGLENDNFIDYALNIQIPELTNSDNSLAYKSVTVNDLKKYSKCFINHFTEVYSSFNKHISVVLYPNIGNNYAVFELFITDEKPLDNIRIINESDIEKELFAEFSKYSYNEKFYQVRDVVHFSENSFCIVKQNFYKNWHPAIAEIDLADVVGQIMSDFGENEK